jgi:hypothetical protein
MLVFGFLGFALGFQHIAEGSSATDSLSEDVINVTDVTEVSQKVLVIWERRKKQWTAYVSAIKNLLTVRAVAITIRRYLCIRLKAL